MTLNDLTPYTLPVQRADWGSLLVEWAPVIPSGSSRWLLSRFGELFLEHADGQIGMLQVSAFRYEVVAKDKKDFEEWLVDPDKMSEWFLAPLVDRLVGGGKTLQPDWCYSFTTPPGLGGQIEEKNVSMLSVRDHFGCWGDIFRQLKDVQDGERVIIVPQEKEPNPESSVSP
jgi:hypothetical protein